MDGSTLVILAAVAWLALCILASNYLFTHSEKLKANWERDKKRVFEGWEENSDDNWTPEKYAAHGDYRSRRPERKW